ncbi:hypothetical protein SO802_003829 [Lithocarpus litseifolius]|uniref:Uncharacterized protein n=1 Tax=Lithocarpus litseifolius TaxID=425828 RepID=A0AAW2E547_9ROSI
MLTTRRVQPKKPSKALFMQRAWDPNAPDLSKRNSLEDAIPKQLVLLCSEKAVYVYSLTHIIQGVKKVHYKKCFEPLLVVGHQHFTVPLMLNGLFSFLLVEKFR